MMLIFMIMIIFMYYFLFEYVLQITGHMFTLLGWHLFGSKNHYPLNSVEIIYKKAVQVAKKCFSIVQAKKKKQGYPSITTVAKPLQLPMWMYVLLFSKKKLIHFATSRF